MTITATSRVMGLVIAAYVASLPCHAQAAEAPSHFAIVQTVLDKHVLPRFQVLEASAAKLPAGVNDVCANGDGGAREGLIGSFRRVVSDWAAVEYLRFGPIADGGRRERFSFWPDPRGVMARQLRQLIASKDMKAIEGGAISKQSAAVQGLPALEVLLQDKEVPLGPGEPASYRCALAKAIAENLAGLAHEMNDGWAKPNGWKDKMLRPGSDNDTYKEPSEAAGEFVKALLTGMQILGDVEVKPFLDASKDKPASGAFMKSGLSDVYYESGAASLKSLYDSLNLETYLPEDKSWIKHWADGAWRVILTSNGSGGVAASAADVKKEDAPPLKELHARIGGLRQLIGKEMPSAAGLAVGFNELDGD